jgi:hypothetical protein
MEAHTTRRGMLGAIALAPVVIAAPAAASRAPKTSAELRRLIAAYRAIDKRFSLFLAEQHEPAHSAWQNREEARRERVLTETAAIPHYETVATYETLENGSRPMCTVNPIDVAMARRRGTQITEGDFDLCCAELHAAVERRDAIAQAIQKANPPEMFDPVLAAEFDRQERESHAAFKAITGFKPASLADVIGQIQFFQQEDHEIDSDDLLSALSRIQAGGLN